MKHLWKEEEDILTPRIQYSSSYCSVTEKPDVMVLAYVMVEEEADMVVNKEADIVVDDVADMEVDKVANMVTDKMANEVAAIEVDKMADMVADMDVGHGGRRGGRHGC